MTFVEIWCLLGRIQCPMAFKDTIGCQSMKSKCAQWLKVAKTRFLNLFWVTFYNNDYVENYSPFAVFYFFFYSEVSKGSQS